MRLAAMVAQMRTSWARACGITSGCGCRGRARVLEARARGREMHLTSRWAQLGATSRWHGNTGWRRHDRHPARHVLTITTSRL